jgi:hypothetical protein
MSQNILIILEWIYSPKKFFEEPQNTNLENYSIEINDGKITVTLDEVIFNSNPSIKEMLEEEMENRFLGAQLVNHKKFELSKSTMSRLHPDGRKDVFLFVNIGNIVLMGGNVDFILTNSEGKVTTDTKRERLNRRAYISELGIKHGKDRTAKGLLYSYNYSINDPDNELVHLYEIRDALSQRFGKAEKAKKELGVSSAHWDALGRLANTEPLRQGRHRGEHLSSLRNATEGELEEARTIAVEMVVAYFEYLERNK